MSDTVTEILACLRAWESSARVIGNITAGNAIEAIERLREELAAAEVFHRVAVAERNFERAVCDRLRAEREEYRRLLVEARESVALELGNMNVRLQRSMSSASLHERDEVAGLLSAIDAALAAKEKK